jgi:acetyltransferase
MLTGFFGGYRLRYGDSVAATENAVCMELGEMMREFGKPVVVQSHYAHEKTEALDILRKGGVPFYRHIEIAAQCLASHADYTQARRRLAAIAGEPTTTPAAVPAVQTIVDRARGSGRTALLETEARDALAACGIPVPPTQLAISPADTARIVKALGRGPFALKVVSKDVLHKSDAGGVRLNVVGAAGARAAIEDILGSVRSCHPDADIEGVLVTPMAAKGLELIIGVTRDPQFGPVVMFGLGGIFVETIKDVVFRAVPVAREDAQEMLDDIRFKAMLDGRRGLAPVDRTAIVDLLLKVSALAQAHPEIAEIDLNPVIAHATGYTVADARMILADAACTQRC